MSLRWLCPFILCNVHSVYTNPKLFLSFFQHDTFMLKIWEHNKTSLITWKQTMSTNVIKAWSNLPARGKWLCLKSPSLAPLCRTAFMRGVDICKYKHLRCAYKCYLRWPFIQLPGILTFDFMGRTVFSASYLVIIMWSFDKI